MESPNNHCADDRPYLNLLPQADFSPIFIMGDHRSGTTLLYKTLVATGCFNFVRAYHIIKYNEILYNRIHQTENRAIEELEELFKSLEISDRNIDRVMATPDLPEEYGFILKNVAGDNSCITKQNLPVFQQLCRKIQFASDPDKPLLLKNPWDLPQFMYVKSVVPNAKFIFIHRHPIHVIN
jgi:Sulfotransferase family